MTFYRAHIDESYNDDVFVLSCAMTEAADWFYLTYRWERCIEQWNKRLAKEGRPIIERYWAADCSNRYGAFRGWSPQEQKEFTSDLLKSLRGYELDTKAFGIDL